MQKRKVSLILLLAVGVFFAIALSLLHVPCELYYSKTLTMVIKRGTRLEHVAKELKKEGLIRSECLFILGYILYGRRIVAGEYEFTTDMSAKKILSMLREGKRKIYAIRIIEGQSLDEVSSTFEKVLGIRREDFLRLAKDPDYLKSLKISSPSIEGYLFPDTYFFSREVELEEFIRGIIKRQLSLLEEESLKERMRQLGFGVHEVLTLASLIEKEAKLESEKPLISAVFHNRLRLGMPLMCDPTVLYGQQKRRIRRVDLMRRTPYNTYTFSGLPLGPICNPSKSSIVAALYPAKVKYLYFVSRNDGTHAFSTNPEEHERYVDLYQRR